MCLLARNATTRKWTTSSNRSQVSSQKNYIDLILILLFELASETQVYILYIILFYTLLRSKVLNLCQSSTYMFVSAFAVRVRTLAGSIRAAPVWSRLGCILPRFVRGVPVCGVGVNHTQIREIRVDLLIQLKSNIPQLSNHVVGGINMRITWFYLLHCKPDGARLTYLITIYMVVPSAG